MAAMSTIVDVLYRGVPLAQQVTLAPQSQVQAMVPHVAPMPVGTPLAVRVGDAAPIAVVVVGVREAHGEADAAAAGMLIAPAPGAGEAAQAIWDQVVAGAPPAVARRGTDELAATQVAEATATAAAVARAAAIEPGAEPKRRTRELSSQEIAAVAQAAGTVAEPIRPVRASKPPEVRKAEEAARAAAGAVASDGIVDDGKATTVMEAVSPELLAQLGMEAGASGAMAAAGDAPVEADGDGGVSAPVAAPTAGPGDKGGKGKKKSKKR